MTQDVSATADDGSSRAVRSEAEWRTLMTEYERRNGTQVSFRKARGVPQKTFQGWRRKRGLTAGAAAGKLGGFVKIAPASGPGWDIELSLGDGVVLRLRRP